MPRLGELLVQASAISEEQLEFALRHQKQHGGRLGTNLVEMGFVSESALARTLSGQLRLPAVSAAALEKVPADVVKLLPKDSAAHHRAVPVRLDGKHLWVAMSDPTDTRAIAELDAVTRHTVRPMVAPDVLISYALERHYGIPHRRRSDGDVSPHLDLRIETGARSHARTDAAPVPFPDPVPTAERVALQARVQDLDEHEVIARPRLSQGRLGASALGARLVGAASQRDVFEAALAFLSQDFGRIAVLVVRNARLAGFIASGKGVNQSALPDINLPPRDVPVLAKVLSDGRPRLGRASPQTLGGLTRVLGAPGDKAVLVVGVRCAGEPVACIVASEGNEGVESYVDEYVACGQKLDWALQLIVLKKRILEG